jgi:hypothetical protein
MKMTWKPIMAGILEIVGGAIGMVGGLYLVALTSLFKVINNTFHISTAWLLQLEQGVESIIAIPFIVVFIGIISIIGGVYSLQRRIWPFALAGAISSCIVFPFFGLFAIIIIAFARNEFS